MDQPLTELDLYFDHAKIFAELTDVFWVNALDDKMQILLTHRPGDDTYERWTYGAGSLWSDELKKCYAHTRDFSQLNTEIAGLISETIDRVRTVATTFNKRIGRVRVLSLLPKTCYSLHVDPDEVRFHIPLVTSHSSFFVVGTEVVRMPEPGRLYLLKTNEEHTAVNASLTETRHHLVFDTYD